MLSIGLIIQRVLLVLAVCILGQSVAFATIGGKPTNELVHSSIVNIVFKTSVCSGVVVAPNVVMTAAHCLNRGKFPKLVAHINNGVITPECGVQKVVDYSLEPSAVLSTFKVHFPDILLLKIEAPLCGAKPVTLSDEPLKASDVVKLAGHGRWEFGHAVSTEISVKLIETKEAKGHTFVESNPMAKKAIKNFLEQGSDSYLFALPEKEQTSACMGDSGGPVFTEADGNMYLHGVIGTLLSNEKLGVSSCGYAYVQSFTPIEPYFEWIQSKIQEWK